MELHGNPLQEALLIKAQSRIVQLESELSRLRQDALAHQLKRDFSDSSSTTCCVTDVQKQNQVSMRDFICSVHV